MEWVQGDMIEIAKTRGITHIAFSANSTLNGRRLTMGAGAALAVKKQFPKIDLNVGTQLAYMIEIDCLQGDYYYVSTETISYGTRGWPGMGDEAAIIRVTAVQVKRDWRDRGDWDLTVKSLTLFRDYLKHLARAGETEKAIINCPLIGRGGFAKESEKVFKMVESIFEDTDITVCRKE